MRTKVWESHGERPEKEVGAGSGPGLKAVLVGLRSPIGGESRKGLKESSKILDWSFRKITALMGEWSSGGL